MSETNLGDIKASLVGDLVPGEITAVLGTSHSGKTETLIKLAAIEAIERETSDYDEVIFVVREEQPELIARKALFYFLKHLGEIPEGMSFDETAQFVLDDDVIAKHWGNIKIVYVPLDVNIPDDIHLGKKNTLFLIDGVGDMTIESIQSFKTDNNSLVITASAPVSGIGSLSDSVGVNTLSLPNLANRTIVTERKSTDQGVNKHKLTHGDDVKELSTVKLEIF